MSLNLEGKSCPVCKAYLFKEDDIVYCPICGAPHHRECYKKLGHCAYEDTHGTPEQYCDKEESKPVEEEPKVETQNTIACNVCGAQFPVDDNTCPKCGSPNISKFGNGFASIDFLGGVPADFNIGEDVTASEARRFVVSNSPRYVRKFAILNRSHRTSWNWLAFLFPCPWFLSRKMYKSGIISGILSLIFDMLSIPLSQSLYANGVYDGKTYAEIIQNISDFLPYVAKTIVIAATVGTLLKLALRIFCAMFGDYFYKSYTVKSIKQIKTHSDDIDMDYRKKGGVSFFLMAIGMIATVYLPQIISQFF